jgi:hypothetical protein
VSAALLRVRGELVADGFDVTLVEARPGVTSAAAMAAAVHDPGSATVGLFLSPDGASAELWVVDRLTGKSVVRRVTTGSEPAANLSEVLALRAVELLRASLLELAVDRRDAPAPMASAVSADTASRASRWASKPLGLGMRSSWAIEVGAGTALDPGRIGPALILAGGLRISLADPLLARLRFVGFGTRPRISGPEGSASLQQSWGLGEVIVLPWPSWLVRPAASIGAGVLNLQVDGEASWPYRALHRSAWAFAADVGLGCGLRITPRIELLLEGHAGLAAPHPVLRLAGRSVASVGQPTVLGTLAFVGSL